MQLNKKGKDELRARIEEQLSAVPEGQKIHLEEDLLESLLFDTIVCNKKTGETVRLPIWSGEFLRKLDLSGISFDNVAWSLITEPGRDTGYDEVFDRETWERFNTLGAYDREQRVNYSGTNAHIDFSKSWETKHGSFDLINCDFSNVDLSHNDMSRVGCIYNCSLSNSGIVLLPEMFKSNTNRFSNTDFTNVDLSGFTINGRTLVEGMDECLFDENCNLSNSGIKITISSEDVAPKESGLDDSGVDPNYIKRHLYDMIEAGYLDGCYINGERRELSQDGNEEYEKYKDGLISSVSRSIAEQTGSLKK